MAEFKPIMTQEEFDAAIGERFKRERTTVAKQYEGYLSPEAEAEKYKGFLSPADVNKKFEGYLTPEQAAEKDAKIKGYETNSVKMRIAHENGIPFELVDRLNGENEDEIRKDAENLSKFLSDSSNPTYPLASTEPDASNTKDAALKKMVQDLKGE